MHCFEMLVARTSVQGPDGPVPDSDRLSYALPEAAEQLLEPLLEPYGQDPYWYFDRLGHGRPPAPWAMVCLDQEHRLAGHVVSTRPREGGIRFSPYRSPPRPMPDDFVPGVGVLVCGGRAGLEVAAGASPLFAAAFEALRDCPPDRHWLAVLDPLPCDWLAEVARDDRQQWFASRG